MLAGFAAVKRAMVHQYLGHTAGWYPQRFCTHKIKLFILFQTGYAALNMQR